LGVLSIVKSLIQLKQLKGDIAAVEELLNASGPSENISEELAGVSIEVITELAKKLCNKTALQKIILKCGEEEYPFPAEITFETQNGIIEADYELLKSKHQELYYKYEALCADFCNQYEGNSKAALEVFELLCNRLNALNWSGICKADSVRAVLI
jgi:hypothetical protein